MSSIEEIKEEYKNLLKKLSDPELISDWEKLEKLSKKKKFLEKITEKDKEIQEIKNKIEENKGIISSGEDSDLISLAEEDIKFLVEKQKKLERELEDLLKNEESSSHESAIIEIRAGTGGEEAALFAADLFRMYSKYGASHNWKQKILDSRPTELGGFKEIIFAFKNGDVFKELQYEGGVHRIQRIPATEKSGRIHTSTASVAVLPKPKTAQIKISPNDLKIDFYNASGPGGQNVNKRKTAVRITHLPTGLAVTSQVSRNQQENKEYAFSILEARLLRQKEILEEERISGKRKTQIKGAKRAEKIRTYNFPQNRVTDHRINKSWHQLEEILNGNLENVIATIQKASKEETN